MAERIVFEDVEFSDSIPGCEAGDHIAGRNPNEDRADWYDAEAPWGPEPIEVLGGAN